MTDTYDLTSVQELGRLRKQCRDPDVIKLVDDRVELLLRAHRLERNAETLRQNIMGASNWSKTPLWFQRGLQSSRLNAMDKEARSIEIEIHLNTILITHLICPTYRGQPRVEA